MLGGVRGLGAGASAAGGRARRRILYGSRRSSRAKARTSFIDFPLWARPLIQSVIFLQVDGLGSGSASTFASPSALRPNGAEKLTGSPAAYPYRLSLPASPIGSSCVNRDDVFLRMRFHVSERMAMTNSSV